MISNQQLPISWITHAIQLISNCQSVESCISNWQFLISWIVHFQCVIQPTNCSLGMPPKTKLLHHDHLDAHCMHEEFINSGFFWHVWHADTQWWLTVHIWTDCPICSMCAGAQPNPFPNHFWIHFSHSTAQLVCTGSDKANELWCTCLIAMTRSLTASMQSVTTNVTQMKIVFVRIALQKLLIFSMCVESSNHAWCCCHIPIHSVNWLVESHIWNAQFNWSIEWNTWFNWSVNCWLVESHISNVWFNWLVS